ncbi:MAG TPA: hypothetical protein VIM33_08265 [Gaiellaceae bacterium]
MATRVVIAGGGVAALEAALALRALAEDRVSVEMLAPEPQFWYRPLAVAESFDLGEVRQFELPELAAAAGATFSLGALAGVDAGRRLARTCETMNQQTCANTSDQLCALTLAMSHSLHRD